MECDIFLLKLLKANFVVSGPVSIETLIKAGLVKNKALLRFIHHVESVFLIFKGNILGFAIVNHRVEVFLLCSASIVHKSRARWED